MIHLVLQAKLKTLIVTLICILLLSVFTHLTFIWFQPIQVIRVQDDASVMNEPTIDNDGLPVILWWTSFTGEKGAARQCGSNQCFFTNGRQFYQHPDLQVLLFYGSSLTPDGLPPALSHKTRPLWGLLHEESPKNVALLQHSIALSLFNVSATFSRHSHFPLTLQHLPSKQALTGLEYFVTTGEKNQRQSSLGLAPVVYVQSDCDTPSERDTYIAELMKYIPIDSYGACLQNKKLPDYLQDAMQGMHHPEFRHLLAQYKFVIAFENAVCEDYITEKLWRPLILGSVPIYYGSPTIQDWLPNNNSVIKISSFESPQKLANFLFKVNVDDTLYESYLEHKVGKQRISNDNLMSSLATRTWTTESDNYSSKNFVGEFECFVCEQIHARKQGRQSINWAVTGDHYQCPPPISPVTGRENKNNWWLEQWYQGRAEASVLHKFVTGKKTFTIEQFYDAVGKLLLSQNP